MLEGRIDLEQELRRIVRRITDHRLAVDREPRFAVAASTLPGLKSPCTTTERVALAGDSRRLAPSSTSRIERRSQPFHLLAHVDGPLGGDVGDELVAAASEGSRHNRPRSSAPVVSASSTGSSASSSFVPGRHRSTQRVLVTIFVEEQHRAVAVPEPQRGPSARASRCGNESLTTASVPSGRVAGAHHDAVPPSNGYGMNVHRCSHSRTRSGNEDSQRSPSSVPPNCGAAAPDAKCVIAPHNAHQRGRASVPRPAVMKSASPGSCTSAVCHTPGGLTTPCRSQLDHAVFAVDLLDQIDTTGEQHYELVTGGVPFPRVPRCRLFHQHDEPTFVAVDAVRST